MGPDDEAASELDELASRAERRGATVTVAALERAATLSHDSTRRGERLLRAAELAFELGRRDLVAGPARRALIANPYEHRLRDNEARVQDQRPLRGGRSRRAVPRSAGPQAAGWGAWE